MTIIGESVDFFRDRWAERFADADADTCVITEPGEPTFDPGTGTYTPGAGTTIYDGACIVRPLTASDVQAGEQQVELRGYLVMVPWDTTGVGPDQLVAVTSTRDPVLNGKELVVRNVASDSYVTRRAVFCDDNQGG